MPESIERGALTEAVYYILLALWAGPLHGYGIMQHIRQLSGERVVLGPGTLYGALNTLLEKGWIQADGEEKGRRKKAYAITDSGRAMVAGELARLQELLANGRRITGEDASCGM